MANRERYREDRDCCIEHQAVKLENYSRGGGDWALLT